MGRRKPGALRMMKEASTLPKDTASQGSCSHSKKQGMLQIFFCNIPCFLPNNKICNKDYIKSEILSGLVELQSLKTQSAAPACTVRGGFLRSRACPARAKIHSLRLLRPKNPAGFLAKGANSNPNEMHVQCISFEGLCNIPFCFSCDIGSS